MKSKNISSAIESLLDDFILVQKDITRVSDLYAVVVREAESAVIRKIMLVTYRNKTQAAKILGISRNTLNSKIKSFITKDLL